MQAIPAPVQAVIDLFADDLADVRFPDVDGAVLGRLASEVEAASSALAAAQAALDQAREALHQRQDALLHGAQRAVAYARVFAESNEALAARLGAIHLSRPAPASAEAAPRRRGRPPKARSETLSLDVPAGVPALVVEAAE
jgi:hypothetical protein